MTLPKHKTFYTKIWNTANWGKICIGVCCSWHQEFKLLLCLISFNNDLIRISVEFCLTQLCAQPPEGDMLTSNNSQISQEFGHL